jgi:hypothetical protein
MMWLVFFLLAKAVGVFFAVRTIAETTTIVTNPTLAAWGVVFLLAVVSIKITVKR